MCMMKKILFLGIYVNVSKVPPGHTALGARPLVRNAA